MGLTGQLRSSTKKEQFPVSDNLLYLNHAAVAPLPRRSADAIKHLAEDALRW